jgi:NMD protein affecting ribosome stability and mRNA decay
MKVKIIQTMNKRKSMDTTQDPYILKVGNSKTALCRKCHATYQNKRWYISKELYDKKAGLKDTKILLCPACLKIKDKFPGGIVKLKGAFLQDHETEIMNLIRNEEIRSMGFNPLERIIEIIHTREEIEVKTTNEKLAQRITRRLERAYQGKVEYKWSNGTKLLRAEWVR